MKNKKGFAFVETIIIVVILCSSLLLLYSTYSAIISDEKNRIYYDDPAFIYYTNYVKKFLEEYINLDMIKENYFENTYIATVGVQNYDDVPSFYNTTYGINSQYSLETVRANFKINQIILIKSEMYDKCFDGTEPYCENSISNLTYKMKKYVNSLSDTSSKYILAVEYSFKFSDEVDANGEKKLVRCAEISDKRCKTYYASVGLN